MASDFTVLYDADSWADISITVLTIGLLPILGGWLSPKLWNAVLFPIGVLLFLVIVTAINGPLSSDIDAIGLVILLTVVCGGVGFLAFCAGWIARQCVRRLQDTKGNQTDLGSLGLARDKSWSWR